MTRTGRSSPAPGREAHRKPLPEELSAGGPDLDQAAGQAFPFHHRGHRRESVALDQAAGDPRRGCALPRRDDDAKPVVSAPPHGTPAGIHHETHQETRSRNGRSDAFLNIAAINKPCQVGFPPSCFVLKRSYFMCTEAKPLSLKVILLYTDVFISVLLLLVLYCFYL